MLYRILNRTSWVLGFVCVAIVVILAGNLVVSRRFDPLEVTQLEQMQLQLAASPNDEQLRSKVRELDRQVRDGYFRHRDFALNGLIVLAAAFIALAATRAWADSVKAKQYAPDLSLAELAATSKAKASQGVFAVGILFAGIFLAAASTARHDTVAAYAKYGMPLLPPEKEPEKVASAQPAGGFSPLATPEQPSAPPALGGAVAPTGGTLAPYNPGTQVEAIQPSKTEPEKPRVAPEAKAGIQAWVPAAWKDEWPRFRGPAGNGVATSNVAPPGPQGSKVLWKVPTKTTGWNSPIVFGDRIFLASAEAKTRQIVCFSATDGKELWRSNLEAPKVAVSVSKDTGYAPSTMATDGNRVYAIFPDGMLFALKADGKPAWSRSFGKPDNVYGHATSLLCYGSGLIVQIDQGSAPEDGKSALYALDSATGKTIWEVKRPVGPSWTTPVVISVGGTDQLVTLANPLVIGYNAADGKELWRVDGFGGEPAPSPAFDSNRLVVSAMGSYMFSIDPSQKGDISKSGVHWDSSDMLPDTSSPLLAAGFIYSVSPDGTIVAFDAKTGQIAWEQQVGTVKSSPVLVGDNVWFFDLQGNGKAFQAGKAYKVLGSISLGEEVSASPAVVRGRMYVRGKAHLFCIGP